MRSCHRWFCRRSLPSCCLPSHKYFGMRGSTVPDYTGCDRVFGRNILCCTLWISDFPIRFVDFSRCLTHLSISLYWVTSCRPSPCAELSPARTTTAAPLPCWIFSGFPHSPFGRSSLGNLRLGLLNMAYCDVGVGFSSFTRLSRLAAVGISQYAKKLYVLPQCTASQSSFAVGSPMPPWTAL